ncbi:branched-chain amino acid transport system II carrier protein [uncultured Anaerococcus sp.]|uniref:branched-chain amino acid transport system II carrier protein n=1 Tax=uncultured Anaerococcus sp. TaxID=293428 RepID=UPI00288C1C0C|nr:branched-chain amino acid transport system II carrier protein [uncultured Anaerococcus sp.]
MRKNLQFKEILLVGSLLFGLFFGAGNLIFPLELGYGSGGNILPVSIGFILSAVGLPILGVVSASLTDSDNLFELSRPGGTFFAYAFTIILYLAIGPGFAIPRTANVSFEVGFAGPYNIDKTIGLLVFSVVFFILVLVFSVKRAKLIDTIGKYMTPIFILLLSVLIVFSIIKPMAGLGTGYMQEKYVNNPFAKGIIDGYNTMDAPASLAFAIIIISAVKQLGVKNEKNIAKETLKAGLVCLVAMSIIYGFLAFIGNTSSGILKGENNGAVILSKVSYHYLGKFGYIMLTFIVFLACLKTAIGLVSAASEMFERLLPFRITYKVYCYIFSALSFLVANLGLDTIIKLSLPILLFLYPIAIVLITSSILSIFIGRRELVYKSMLLFTAIGSLADLFKNLPLELSTRPIVRTWISISERYLPGAKIGFSWIAPALIGLIIGLILDRILRRNLNKEIR